MSSITTIVQHVAVYIQFSKVLNDVSFTLQPGQHLAIMGSNGSGKTTLAKAIMGIIHYDGKINFTQNGENIPFHKAYVPFQLDIKKLADQNFYYYQQRYNYRDAADSKTILQYLKVYPIDQVEQLLGQLKLSHRANAPLLQLSNGELKKLQIIEALLSNPQLLVLDAPFTGLDVSSRKELHHIINAIADKGTQIILVTNHQEIPGCITHYLELEKGTAINFAPIEAYSSSSRAQPQGLQKPVPETNLSNNHTGSLISFNNVNVQYGDKHILKNISWEVTTGDCWWISGENGAGKSTLLSLVTGDNPQAYGQEVYLFGNKRGSGESIWDIKKKIGFVSPELFNFFDKDMNLFDTLASGLYDTIGLYQLPTDSERAIIQKWINFLEMQHKAFTKLERLSVGEQRLVLLARVMIKNPSLLIFDEPFQGLDSIQTQLMTDLIDKVHAETGTTVLLVHHYEENIPECINKRLVLSKGSATTILLHKKTYATV